MIMCEASVSSFIEDESRRIHSQGALDHRRRDLMTFYRWLPDDKKITKERLADWRQFLVDNGYTYNTQVNYVKSVNRYLRFIGKEDWCFSRGKGLDLKGKTFGYLTALEPTDKRYRKDIVWLCQCQCGKITEVPATRLVSGNTLSCGCLKAARLHTGNKSQIASASWTPAGRNFVIIATVLVGASDSTKIGAAAAGQAA